MSEPQGAPSRLGSYPIDRELGRGGMGVVYLGRDTKLGRPVALKVLPEHFARDPERLSRFEREARLLASLNHPNIAGIYGLEESDGVRFLALEYVDGETLAERLARGPLPVDETLEVCRQVAAAVESAHEHGVIHRDLKPGNVKRTPAGEVKVLDFGLAKGGQGAEEVSDPDLTHSPTRAYSGTVAGVILGTAAYMSPEQARGKPVDRRTDIWSFGCVLFECLTGRQAFPGETVSDMIARILQGEPDWQALPGHTPAAVRALLTRCFEKDARKRLRDIGEARLELERAVSGEASSMVLEAPRAPASRLAWLPWGLAAGFALLAGWLLISRMNGDMPDAHVFRASILLPGGLSPAPDAALSALSPDGTQLAFAARDSSGWFGLWLHSFVSNTTRRLEGTENAGPSFWAPDGRQLGFFTSDKLHKLDLATGSVEPLCAATWGRGATWSPHGVILFSPGPESPLFTISPNGGTPVQATALDTAAGETGHRYPCFLPDGEHFTYASLPASQGAYGVHLASLETQEPRLLFGSQGAPVYVEPGYLVYARGNRLAAQRFDAGRGRLQSEAVPLGDAPALSEWSGHPLFTASRSGDICLVGGVFGDMRLVWADPSGRNLEDTGVPPGPYDQAAPDFAGRMVAFRRKTSNAEYDLWLADLARGTATRFTFGPGRAEEPRWSRDGSRLAYSTDRRGPYDILVKGVGGAAPEEVLYVSPALFKYPCDWSPDGRFLLLRQIGERTNWDLWTLPLEGDRTPVPYVQTPFNDTDGQISPDGRWAAYVSDDAGANRVYVQSFPTPGRRYQVSGEGGEAPQWRADGRALAYFGISPGPSPRNVIFVVDFRADGDEVILGTPTPVFTRVPGAVSTWLSWDFTRQLSLVRSGGGSDTRPVTLIRNWQGSIPKP